MSLHHGDPRPGVDYRIEECDDPRVDDVSFLRDRLIEFNRQFLGTDAREPLAVFARDGDGSIVGGLSGVVSRGWLHVELLWVAPEMRGAGLGRELVERAERGGSDRVLSRSSRFPPGDAPRVRLRGVSKPGVPAIELSHGSRYDPRGGARPLGRPFTHDGRAATPSGAGVDRSRGAHSCRW